MGVPDSFEDRRVLVIDDERTFDFDCVYARNCKDAIAYLRDQEWDEVWFDHDLGEDPEDWRITTIYPVVHFIEECAFYGRRLPIGECVIHTANPVGRQMLERALSPLYKIIHVDGDFLKDNTR